MKFIILCSPPLSESGRLQMDLQKVEQLEGKITAELENLKVRIKEMEEELKTFSNLDTLQQTADQKKKVCIYDHHFRHFYKHPVLAFIFTMAIVLHILPL